MYVGRALLGTCLNYTKVYGSLRETIKSVIKNKYIFIYLLMRTCVNVKKELSYFW